MGSEAMSPHVMKKLAKPMLFAAAIIWGTSFFVMKNALDVIPVFYLLAIRFTAGAVLLAAVCWKKWAGFTRDYLWRGAVIGAFLFLAYSVQTFGLDRTTPSKNAFLTAVYCVIVPFLYWAAARRRPDRYNILAALLCVTGVGLVSLDGDLSVNAGDVLTLICAFFYAAHIVAVAKVSPEKDIYLLTVFQFAFAALYAWAGGALFENFPAQAFLAPAVCLPMAYLCVMATTVALLFQNVGQVWSDPASASVILSLESVFGVISSVLFYGDLVTLPMAVGFACIFVAVVCEEPVTREQAAVMLTAVYQYRNEDNRKAFLLWVALYGRDNDLNDDSNLTEQQASNMLAGIYHKLDTVISSVGAKEFADDGEISDWAKNSVYFMEKNGIITGVGGDRFDPQADIQAQAALVMSVQMLQKLG